MWEKRIPLPVIIMTGGFSFEDHIFKGLALGSPYIKLIGIGRAAMTAAMVGKTIGDLIEKGTIPAGLSQYGQSISEIFCRIPGLKARFGHKIEQLPFGAIEVFDDIKRINTGLRQLMPLCRKFSFNHIDRDDIIPLTEEAASVTGLTSIMELDSKEIDKIIKK